LKENSAVGGAAVGRVGGAPTLSDREARET
jgi:hypothetical protein